MLAETVSLTLSWIAEVLRLSLFFYRLPPPKLPAMNVLSEVVTEAFGVALVGYVASLALAQSSAKRFKYTVDDNQVKFFLFI